MAKRELIGRTAERALLQDVLDSGKAELVALYGRRRVGKTHLVRHFLQPRAGTYLETTGTRGGSAVLQRRRFRESLERDLCSDNMLPDLRDWEGALSYLTGLVEQRRTRSPGEPIVLFFDEVPWMATPRSGLLGAIDHCWNTRWSRMPEVKVVLCGSAASWMLRRVVQARGGCTIGSRVASGSRR